MSGGEQEGSVAAERYRLAGEILLAALEQTPAERSRFVREACRGIRPFEQKWNRF